MEGVVSEGSVDLGEPAEPVMERTPENRDDEPVMGELI
jgi:hypothetical protein